MTRRASHSRAGKAEVREGRRRKGETHLAEASSSAAAENRRCVFGESREDDERRASSARDTITT
jgi:hypothetical protein